VFSARPVLVLVSTQLNKIDTKRHEKQFAFHNISEYVGLPKQRIVCVCQEKQVVWMREFCSLLCPIPSCKQTTLLGASLREVDLDKISEEKLKFKC
jgi:hypothetical protein